MASLGFPVLTSVGAILQANVLQLQERYNILAINHLYFYNYNHQFFSFHVLFWQQTASKTVTQAGTSMATKSLTKMQHLHWIQLISPLLYEENHLWIIECARSRILFNAMRARKLEIIDFNYENCLQNLKLMLLPSSSAETTGGCNKCFSIENKYNKCWIVQ